MSQNTGPMLSKEERVRRALVSAEVDRPPYSFWRHFPGTDLDPVALVEQTVRFAAELDLDFVKAMSNGFYCVEDWGAVADYSAISQGGVAHVVRTPIAEATDWRHIRRLPVTAPALSRELRHLAGLADALGRRTPLLATVFSPLTIAHKMAGAHKIAGAHEMAGANELASAHEMAADVLARHVRQAPELVLGALENIALTMADFARHALAAGCAGVYFAVQDADPARFDDAAYGKFGEPFDRMVLDAAASGWFNVVHMHGSRILFDRLKEYPVAALNWHIGQTPPSVAAYRDAGGRQPIVGGLRRDGLTRCDIKSVAADLALIFAATAGRGLLLSPGCVIRNPVDMAFLKHVATRIATDAEGLDASPPKLNAASQRVPALHPKGECR
jgi:uroporphyrinogen decarboxylase